MQLAAVAAVSEAAATIIARVKAASGGSTLRPDLKGASKVFFLCVCVCVCARTRALYSWGRGLMQGFLKFVYARFWV